MSSYSLASEHQSSYRIDEYGNAVVTVRSKSPLKPRAVYVGEASMEFQWVHSGKSSHWQFTPTILNPTQTQYSEATEGQEQVITIEVPKIIPASGLVGSNVVGEIRAPAIKFDLPYATDLWVFILRSPWAPMEVTAEKQMLNINHTLAYATAQVESSGEGDALRIYVTMHGEGFTNVILSLKRRTNHGGLEENLGEIKYGGLSATWKPTTRNFDAILTTHSSMSENDFLGFLASLGAEVNKGFFASIRGDFLLSDGPSMEYTLTLKGEKKYIGKEEASTRVKLSLTSSQDSDNYTY